MDMKERKEISCLNLLPPAALFFPLCWGRTRGRFKSSSTLRLLAMKRERDLMDLTPCPGWNNQRMEPSTSLSLSKSCLFHSLSSSLIHVQQEQDGNTSANALSSSLCPWFVWQAIGLERGKPVGKSCSLRSAATATRCVCTRWRCLLLPSSSSSSSAVGHRLFVVNVSISAHVDIPCPR